jgi:hypothetical protein
MAGRESGLSKKRGGRARSCPRRWIESGPVRVGRDRPAWLPLTLGRARIPFGRRRRNMIDKGATQ